MDKKKITTWAVIAALFSISVFGLFAAANMNHSVSSDCPFSFFGGCVPTDSVLAFISHHAKTVQNLSQLIFSAGLSLLAVFLLAAFIRSPESILSRGLYMRKVFQISFEAKKEIWRWLVFNKNQIPSLITAPITV